MGESNIEWTQHTWNPIVGCSLVSPGCTNCYAMKQAARIERMNPHGHYVGLTQASKAGAVWTGKLALAPEVILLAPLKRKKPTTWFVNSMGDIFHEDCPDEWIDRVFAVMARCSQHKFQLLTKRTERMADYADRWGVQADMIDPVSGDPMMTPWPLPNVWIGTSAEDQQRADERIPLLLHRPAAVRFVSLEPLLGAIDLHRWALGYGGGAVSHCENCGHGHGFTRCPNTGGIAKTARRNGVECLEFRRKIGWGGLDWVIVGGESGPHARPMHPDWVRSLRDQCAAAGVPFFFKQWGEHLPLPGYAADGEYVIPQDRDVPTDIRRTHNLTGEQVWKRVGKRAAGRLLDGVEHNGMPT